jgi:hypothetical protein
VKKEGRNTVVLVAAVVGRGAAAMITGTAAVVGRAAMVVIAGTTAMALVSAVLVKGKKKGRKNLGRGGRGRFASVLLHAIDCFRACLQRMGMALHMICLCVRQDVVPS